MTISDQLEAGAGPGSRRYRRDGQRRHERRLFRGDAHGGDQVPGEVAGFNDVIRRSGEYLTRLTGDLVLLAQIDGGAVALRRVPVDVAEAVAAVAAAAAVRDMAPTAARHDARLDVRAAEGPRCRGTAPATPAAPWLGARQASRAGVRRPAPG